MKIFDYTDGTKGKMLAEVGYCHATGGWLVRKGLKVFRVQLAERSRKPARWNWVTNASYRSGKPIRPEDFGVEAICFCLGEMKAGIDESFWQWHIVGTDAWNRKACQTGILKSKVVEELTVEKLAERLIVNGPDGYQYYDSQSNRCKVPAEVLAAKVAELESEFN